MASKPKSRTSKNNLNKKAHVPVWAIALGVVVLVGLGAFFVFKSFASGVAPESSGNTSRYLPCNQGTCYYVSENDAITIPKSFGWSWKSVRGNVNCNRYPYYSQLEYYTGSSKKPYICLTKWPQ